MGYNCVYLVPNHQGASATVESANTFFSTITNSIESHFNATRQGQWSLAHRLLRAPWPTQPGNDATPPQQQAFQIQSIFHLPHLSQSKTYCYTRTSPPAPSSQSSEPQSSVVEIHADKTESHVFFLNKIMSWNLRNTFNVTNGLTFTVGPCTVRVGTLVSPRHGYAGTISPGVIVCITHEKDVNDQPNGPSDVENSGYTTLQDGSAEPDPWEGSVGEDIVTKMWSIIAQDLGPGNAGAREFKMATRPTKGRVEEDHAVVMMWCRAMETRA